MVNDFFGAASPQAVEFKVPYLFQKCRKNNLKSPFIIRKHKKISAFFDEPVLLNGRQQNNWFLFFPCTKIYIYLCYCTHFKIISSRLPQDSECRYLGALTISRILYKAVHFSQVLPIFLLSAISQEHCLPPNSILFHHHVEGKRFANWKRISFLFSICVVRVTDNFVFLPHFVSDKLLDVDRNLSSLIREQILHLISSCYLNEIEIFPVSIFIHG